MSMIRAKNKAMRIAERTIPGLNKMSKMGLSKRKIVPKDDVELKIVKVNQGLGKLTSKKHGL